MAKNIIVSLISLGDKIKESLQCHIWNREESRCAVAVNYQQSAVNNVTNNNSLLT